MSEEFRDFEEVIIKDENNEDVVLKVGPVLTWSKPGGISFSELEKLSDFFTEKFEEFRLLLDGDDERTEIFAKQFNSLYDSLNIFATKLLKAAKKCNEEYDSFPDERVLKIKQSLTYAYWAIEKEEFIRSQATKKMFNE
jgi:hypothetical protein